MSATALAEVYVYEMPDGSRMITDHPINAKHTRVVRVTPDVKGAGELAARKNSPVFRESSSTYDRLIRRYADENGVDFALVKAVMHAESAFNPYAVSNKGARGLMQMMPETARRYGVRDIYNPVENIRAGVQHLKFLSDMFNNKLYLVIAAYNAGENAVKEHQGIPPYAETQMYVRKVLQYQRQYSPRYRYTTLAANPPGG
ncbi:lytic transglycosylase [Sulfuricaulis limicola]|uniref:Lytic transglycosylase n=2 Tax=Sulfuricaulis limicola TaxID=1620215 RepID=A0A1B4XE75_9GAMM|nr:lytic transglycosylase [Sulfuricaulis limicola]